ncbi:Protein of uncharacterised function (DUF1488) [Leminorella richardii]|uniref:Protein of uncharacterized function (DUF1488) n=1 Tax=Leminorella richardii TaxID=158841 RepID=A0A2X4U7S1_9GAMM|nr:DUF1488 domain-containing protein [Leminorella richardii]SQI35213.1 Protein of uncharacterised function (DUF1488) [Leminorella richardii]
MNQAILFSEGERWNEHYAGVQVVALAGGFKIDCCVTQHFLAQHFGEATDPERCCSLFRLHQWDLEEELTARIENEEFNADGWIVI